MELRKRYKSILDKAEINTSNRLSHFFSQLEHESNLKPIQENLNYSAKGLMTTFKKYFPTLDSTKDYTKQPQKIANKVYANRMGNGDEASGDGWKYRGRGFIQITGKSNYTQLSKDTGVDYLNNPDKLLNEADSMISAIWYWSKINGNKWADKDDVRTITKLINGGFNGLEHRTQLLEKYKKMFEKNGDKI